MSCKTLSHCLTLTVLAALTATVGCSKSGGGSLGYPESPSSGAPAATDASWGAAAEAPPASEAIASRGGGFDEDASVRGDVAPSRQRSPGLGTAYGEQRNSSVRSVGFVRESPDTPALTLALRYNDANGVDAISRYKSPGMPYYANMQTGSLAISLRDASGEVLPAAQVGGELYAIGAPGQRYMIGVENHSNERFEVVASVDGLDILDGSDADPRKRGYVVDAYTSFVIEGWRTSDNTVAAFRFSDMQDSYAGRVGKPRNIGVVGAAFFRERNHGWTEELHRRDTADPFPGRYTPPPPPYR